jgi:hypothetical protein
MNNTIEMRPQDFLTLASPAGLRGGPQIDLAKVSRLSKISWEKNPMLSIKKGPQGELQVGLHDGRHRALAAIERGDKTISVDIIRGKKYAREHPETSDADMAQKVVLGVLWNEETTGLVRFKCKPAQNQENAK